MFNYQSGRKLSKDEKQRESVVVAKVKDLYNNQVNQMRLKHYEWLSTMSYVAGDQYTYIDPDNYQIKPFGRINGYEEREVYNLLRNMKNTFLARITQKKPTPIATPITLNEHDKRVASITSAVLDDEWEKQAVDEKIDLIGEYLAYFGIAIIKTVWDKTLGEKVFSNLEKMLSEVDNRNYISEEYYNSLKNGMLVKKSVYEGDVQSSILTPFEFQIDNISRRNMEEVQYCMHTRIFHKDILKKVYGLTDKDLPEEVVNSITLQEGNLSIGVGYLYNSSGYRAQNLKDHNVLIEYYEKPSIEYPNGRFIMTAGKKVVHYGDLPYKNGANGKRDLPFIRIVASEELGSFYGATPIQDLLPLQRKYNAVRNRTSEALNRIGVGQYLVQEQSISKQTKLNNRPGQIIVYKRGAQAPSRMVDNTNLTEFRSEAISLEKEFPAIAGFSRFDAETMKSGIRSATQMSMLFEQEDLRLGTPIKNIAKGIKEWAKQTIRLLQQFTVGERFVKYQKSYDDQLAWNKELINDNIHIKNVSALIKSPAQQTQMVTDMMNMGIFDEQNRYGFENTMMIVESLGMGQFKSELALPNRKDIEKAKRENHRTTKLEGILVDKDVDNHLIHMKQHADYLKSEEYEELIISLSHQDIEKAKLIDKALHEHLKEHQKIVQIKSMNLAMAQQRQQRQ